MDKIKLALVVGHRKSDQGAYNKKYDLTEWCLNKILVAMVIARLDESSIEPIYVLRDDNKAGYRNLPAKINDLNPDYIMEFHCNAAGNINAKGNTVLYYKPSKKSGEFAEILNNTLYDVLGIEKDPLMALSDEGERGLHILKKTKAPCVILEPAFYSNDEDTTNLLLHLGDLAKALANTLNDFCKKKLEESNK